MSAKLITHKEAEVLRDALIERGELRFPLGVLGPNRRKSALSWRQRLGSPSDITKQALTSQANVRRRTLYAATLRRIRLPQSENLAPPRTNV